jgi:hypothetical protein
LGFSRDAVVQWCHGAMVPWCSGAIEKKLGNHFSAFFIFSHRLNERSRQKSQFLPGKMDRKVREDQGCLPAYRQQVRRLVFFSSSIPIRNKFAKS